MLNLLVVLTTLFIVAVWMVPPLSKGDFAGALVPWLVALTIAVVYLFYRVDFVPYEDRHVERERRKRAVRS